MRTPLTSEARPVDTFPDLVFNLNALAYQERWEETPSPDSTVPRWTVELEINDGELYEYERCDLTEAQAVQLAEKVNRAGTVNLDHFKFARTIYGSPAYVRNGIDELIRREEIDMEERGVSSRMSGF